MVKFECKINNPKGAKTMKYRYEINDETSFLSRRLATDILGSS
nr:hypothetical protein [uncultured Campylobacter sp.]